MNGYTRLWSGVKAGDSTFLPRRYEHFCYLHNEAFGGEKEPPLFESGLREQGREVDVGLLSVVLGCDLGEGSPEQVRLAGLKTSLVAMGGAWKLSSWLSQVGGRRKARLLRFKRCQHSNIKNRVSLFSIGYCEQIHATKCYNSSRQVKNSSNQNLYKKQ